jgi:hypothetical protein
MPSTHSNTLYYCWYFIGSGKQRVTVHCIWIPMFVMVLSVPTNHRHWHSTVHTSAPEYLLHKHFLKAHLYFCNNLTLWRMAMQKYIYTKCCLISRTSLLCLKFPSLCLLVLLIRAVFRWRWVQSIRRMILTGKIEVCRQKPVPNPLSPP